MWHLSRQEDQDKEREDTGHTVLTFSPQASVSCCKQKNNVCARAGFMSKTQRGLFTVTESGPAPGKQPPRSGLDLRKGHEQSDLRAPILSWGVSGKSQALGKWGRRQVLRRHTRRRFSPPGGKWLAPETTPEQLSRLAPPLKAGHTCSGGQGVGVAAHVGSVHCHVPRAPAQAPGDTHCTSVPVLRHSAPVLCFSPTRGGNFLTGHQAMANGPVAEHPRRLGIVHAVRTLSSQTTLLVPCVGGT